MTPSRLCGEGTRRRSDISAGRWRDWTGGRAGAGRRLQLRLGERDGAEGLALTKKKGPDAQGLERVVGLSVKHRAWAESVHSALKRRASSLSFRPLSASHPSPPWKDSLGN